MLKLIHVNTEHQNIVELLPWYVNRTLSSDEHELVENHISLCPSCQKEVEFIRSTFDAANEFDASVIPNDDGFNAIMQRIEKNDQAEPIKKETQQRNTAHPKWFQRHQLAIAASFIGAMLMFYWISPYFMVEPGDYQVLTSDNPNTIELRVVFKQDTSRADAQKVLNDADSRFTAGDTHPAYTVRLPDDYDVIKISELVKILNSKSQVSDVKIERDNN